MDDKKKIFPIEITYLFHSGFRLETDKCILVFDYWKDPSDIMNHPNGNKQTYFFSSHFHEDHFNGKIFDWKSSSTTYILSKDILKHRRARKEDADIWMSKGMQWQDNLLRVFATGSNDSGVSWIVETENYRIFHAGDLCNWDIKEEKRYLGELKDIRKIADSFDIVMFPVDARIGSNYLLGIRQFAEKFNVGLFVPMHFSTNDIQSIKAVKNPPLWEIKQEGSGITFINGLFIRKSEKGDISKLMEIFSSARTYMKENGNQDQWTGNYPDENILLEDIAGGDSYVCVKGDTIVGTFVLREGTDPTYRVIHGGKWLNDFPYVTIHRIASSREIKGIFACVMEFALQHHFSIRIDTHRDNIIMQNAIEKMGFIYCGIINCRDGSERLAYQYYTPLGK